MMMLSNNDSQSLIDDQHATLTDDNSSRPDSNNAPAIVGGNKKLKIVLSSLAQATNLTNKQNNNLNNLNNVNNNDQNNTDGSSNLESINKLDSNSLVDLHKQGAAATPSTYSMAIAALDNRGDSNDARVQEKELLFEIKPHLRDFKFEKNMVPVKRGFDNSGLCSIM